MADTQQGTDSREVPPAAFYAGFFICFYSYLLLAVDPALHHDVMRPAFYLTLSFFRETLAGGPGGLTNYLSSFLLGCCGYPYLNALVLTALALLIGAAAQALMTGAGVARPRLVQFIPAVGLLVLQNDYSYPVVNVGLGLLIALLFSLLYAKLAPRRAVFRLPIFVLLSAILYYIVGGPYLMFAALCAIHEIFAARRIALGILCLLLAVPIPFAAAKWIFIFDISEAYRRSWHLSPLTPALALYLFFPLSVISPAIMGALRRVRKPGMRRKPERASARKTAARSVWAFIRPPAYRSLAFLSAAAALVLLSFDGRQKNALQVDYYARLEDWPRVLEHGRALRAGTQSTIANIDRALYHTGRLPHEMFQYPQVIGFGVFPRPSSSSDSANLSHILSELGHATYAQKWAYEALEETGDDPLVLRQLVSVHLLKGETQVARTLLNLLATSPFDRSWAEGFLARLDAGTAITSDSQVLARRALMFTDDYVGQYPGAETILHSLLATNRRNKMAFEYLMAHYLLTRRPEKVVENLGRLNDFDYPEIPRHWEEAVLLHEQISGVPAVIQGARISARTRERFAGFADAARRYGSDEKAVEAALARTHGDTFWYYYTFGRSGLFASASEGAETK